MKEQTNDKEMFILEKSRVREKWKKRFGKILHEIFMIYNLDMEDFIEYCRINDSTLRYWFNGRSFPRQNLRYILKEYLKKNIKNTPQSDQHMYEYTAKIFEGDNLLRYQEIKENFRPVTSFLLEILDECMSKEHCLSRKIPETGEVQAVVFDFDGTLAVTELNRTTWEALWEVLGYDVRECQELHMKYNRHEITHTQWCEITERRFKEKGLTKEIVEQTAKKFCLLDGVEETFSYLAAQDIKIYIVSGSITHMIRYVMGNLMKYVDHVQANQFCFNPDGTIKKILETKYDFEGKANYILNTAKELQISPKDILFVGNSVNDQTAYLSEARTLCINPKLTDITNISMWNNCITECSDLTNILQYVNNYVDNSHN